jgi:NAD(P)-dependent dehydrogenase (short-subunit alcohol dehydrogenase family)
MKKTALIIGTTSGIGRATAHVNIADILMFCTAQENSTIIVKKSL